MIKQDHHRIDIRLLRILAQDSALAGVSEFLSRGFLFGVNLLVSLLLADRAAYGVFSAVSWLAATVFAFTSIGVATTAVRAIAVAREDGAVVGRVLRTTVALIVALALLAGLAVLAAAPWLRSAMDAPVPVDSIRWAALLVCVQITLSAAEAAARGLARFRLLAWSAVFATGVSALPAYFLVSAYGVHGGVFALVLSYGLQTAILLVGVRDHLGAWTWMPWAEMRRFVGGLAIPQWVSGAGFALGMMLPPMMLLGHQEGLQDMGAWNASTQLRVLVTFIPTVMAATAVPHLTGLFRKNSLTLRPMGSYLGAMLVVITASWLVTVWLATELIGLYGASFRSDAALLVLVVSFSAIQVLGNGFSSVLLAAGRVWAPAIIQAAWTVVVLAMAPAVIRDNGELGLAECYVWLAVPVTLFQAWWSWRVRQRGP